MATELSLLVTSEHLALVGAMHVEWADVDLGAPVVSLVPGQASDGDTYRAIREVTRRADWEDRECATAYRAAMDALIPFVQLGTLQPGRYMCKSRPSSKDFGDPPFVRMNLCSVKDELVEVVVTPELLLLLKHANFVLGDDGGVKLWAGMDPKYPYGCHRYYYADMARILGWEPAGPCDDTEDALSPRDFSQQQTDELDRMHYLLQPVLQVYLQKATFPAGAYRSERPGSGRWEPYLGPSVATWKGLHASSTSGTHAGKVR